MKISAVILAGGESRRMGRDKLLIDLFGETVLDKTLRAFKSVPAIDEIVLVGRSSHLADVETKGGKTRRESSLKGVTVASGDVVLIHDAARPFVSTELIEKVVSETLAHRSAVPCVPLNDSVKKIKDGRIVASPRRKDHVAVQTPQGFFKEDILRALSRSSDDITDDSEAYAEIFDAPYVVEGEEINVKLTTPSDVARTGKYAVGYDLHRLEKGRRFILGGVEIPSDKGVIAHSDGDALLHAITDAVLSLAGLRDIGYHFPDTDPRYENADSLSLLKHAHALARERGVKLRDLSAVVIVDRPKLSPYAEQIKSSVSTALGLSPEAVNVSYKTTEKTAEDVIETFCICSSF